ncbi:GlxA family transcriptional regulator [Sphingosinicella sp. CPCC 101087]|uniref:GlxA family transcriptional regulator n=1 Tax=Sphingosinicella sp. CPCC 101087 TaxID=2497754 RepID=UPI00101C2513|nr:GlxA family transcriptional regulator [Sphingosinicella sp. CPCC 101087]
MTRKDRLVLFVAFDTVSALDLSGPLSVFAGASAFLKEDGKTGYDCRIVSIDGGPVRTDLGAAFLSEPVDAFRDSILDMVIVPGSVSMDRALGDQRLIDWIRIQGARARRTCSVCAGTYVLAEAGLLDGRRAATHWAHCDALQRRYPSVKVERDPIFVQDGPIWSSAGVTAGIDLALALVEEDHGRELAMLLARQHVVFLKRPGGQSQFSMLLESQSMEGEAFSDLHKWIMERLDDAEANLTIERLAERVGMSPRNFSRVYKAKTGRTPAKAIELFRLEVARRLLEETDERVQSVAHRTGFGDEERMRTTFHRHLGVSPREYRDRFGPRVSLRLAS